MAKKSSIKVRLSQKLNQTVLFSIMQKNLQRVKKPKVKLKVKKYNPSTRKHEFFVEKKLPPHSK